MKKIALFLGSEEVNDFLDKLVKLRSRDAATPAEYCCPITQTRMMDPVVASGNTVYCPNHILYLFCLQAHIFSMWQSYELLLNMRAEKGARGGEENKMVKEITMENIE